MKVLVLGSGGREHALAWAIARSPGKHQVICAPGNAGTAMTGSNAELDIDDHEGVVDFCKANDIDLVVVGPEAPLVAGIADVLRKNKFSVFGPGSQGANLEGSKIFAKEFCTRHGIPTAAYTVFDDADKAHRFIDKRREETSVVKADGLAAGKGVIVCDDPIDTHAAVDTIITERKFGAAGERVIIEDRLEGFETTLLTIVSGSHYLTLPYSQDHKRAYDGDKGPNTGGMGVFAPTPKVNDELDDWIISSIVEPTIEGLLAEGIDYTGCLYFGLMITEDGPYLLEYNCRFGDPEAQALFPLMEGDFAGALIAAVDGNMDKVSLKPSGKKALSVFLASNGYPGSYKKGVDISDSIAALDKNPDLIVFHAGTRCDGKSIFTSGGRVIAVTGLGDDFGECRNTVYGAIGALDLKGLFYRTDIGRELEPVT